MTLSVTMTDTEFTLTELEEFIATARSIEGIPADGLVVVRLPNAAATTSQGAIQFELSASSGYRSK